MSTTIESKSYDASVATGFWRLFKYISGANRPRTPLGLLAAGLNGHHGALAGALPTIIEQLCCESCTTIFSNDSRTVCWAERAAALTPPGKDPPSLPLWPLRRLAGATPGNNKEGLKVEMTAPVMVKVRARIYASSWPPALYAHRKHVCLHSPSLSRVHVAHAP